MTRADDHPADVASGPRPFRFAVQARAAASGRAWGTLAQRAEDLGYSAMTMPDHLDDQYGPLAGLAAVACATSRLRIGHLVLANDYRHPAVLAKELATLDVISAGRLDLSVGAGHDENDYRAVGLPFDPPGQRIARLTEALDVIYGLFGATSLSMHGSFYRINDLDGYPKPIQSRIPLLIGAGGRKMLRLAAERADIIGINGTIRPGSVPPGVLTSKLPIPHISHESWLSMSAAEVDKKVALIRETAGSRAAHIELSIRAFLTQVTDRTDEFERQLSSDLSLDLDFVRHSPFVLAGSQARIVERLLERRERWGITYIVVGSAEMEAFAPVIAALS